MKHIWKRLSHFHSCDYEYRGQKIDFFPGPTNSHMVREGYQSYTCKVCCINSEGREIVVQLETIYKKHMIWAIDKCLDEDEIITKHDLDNIGRSV